MTTIREAVFSALSSHCSHISVVAASQVAEQIAASVQTEIPRPEWRQSADGDVSLLFYATTFAADGTLADLLRSENPIPAVKYVRSKSNLNLLQAKNVVDLLRQHMGLTKLRIQSNS